MPKPISCTSAPSAPADLAKQPNYRQVVVSAQSQNNQPFPKLTAKDLHLYQGNKELQIAFFKPQAATVGILVDTSGSMETKLPICRTALEAFINDLNPSDEIFLFAFSDRLFPLAQPTTNHASVIKSLALLHAYGRTALYDSLIEGLETISQSCARTRAILLITDGMDTKSYSSLKEAADTARKTKVPIYSIGLGNRGYQYPPIVFPAFAGTADDRVDEKTLNTLAQNADGKTFMIALDDKGAALKEATTAIADKIGNQYIVGFFGGGSTNQLRVEAPNDKGVTLNVTATN